MPASAPIGRPLTSRPLAAPSVAPTVARSNAPCRIPAVMVCRTPTAYQMKSPRVAAAAITAIPAIAFMLTGRYPSAFYPKTTGGAVFVARCSEHPKNRRRSGQKPTHDDAPTAADYARVAGRALRILMNPAGRQINESADTGKPTARGSFADIDSRVTPQGSAINDCESVVTCRLPGVFRLNGQTPTISCQGTGSLDPFRKK